ncbi:MAG: ribosome maturation factor RimP [Nitrospinota bacterium]
MKLEKLESIIAPVIDGGDYELVDLDFRHRKGGSLLQVFVDKVGGINFDDLTSLSSSIGEVLDAGGVIKESYSLEVSSPGIERPLRKLSDFTRFEGKKVKLSLYKPLKGVRSFLCTIQGVQQGRVTFLAESGDEISLQLCEIAKANLYFDFDNK